MAKFPRLLARQRNSRLAVLAQLKDKSMTRTTSKIVTLFVHPFTLEGIDGTQTPGTCEVVTDEGLIEACCLSSSRILDPN